MVKLSNNFLNLVRIEGLREAQVGQCFGQLLLVEHIVIVFIDILKLFPELLKLFERLLFYQYLDQLPLQDGSALKSFQIFNDNITHWSLSYLFHHVFFNPGVLKDLRGVDPLVHIYAGNLLMTTGAYHDAIKAFDNADTVQQTCLASF